MSKIILRSVGKRIDFVIGKCYFRLLALLNINECFDWFYFIPICFASCNVKYLWSTVIQGILSESQNIQAYVHSEFFPTDCSYGKINSKLQKKSLNSNGKSKCFQKCFSVYWKEIVQQPLRTPYIVMYQLLISLVYWVAVMGKYLRIKLICLFQGAENFYSF